MLYERGWGKGNIMSGRGCFASSRMEGDKLQRMIRQPDADIVLHHHEKQPARRELNDVSMDCKEMRWSCVVMV